MSGHRTPGRDRRVHARPARRAHGGRHRAALRQRVAAVRPDGPCPRRRAAGRAVCPPRLRLPRGWRAARRHRAVHRARGPSGGRHLGAGGLAAGAGRPHRGPGRRPGRHRLPVQRLRRHRHRRGPPPGEDPYDLFFADTRNAPGPNPCLVPLDRPPYYAARLVLADLGTKGGLRTDADARVLDAGGRPLPGLYAAGNTSASFTGRVYPGPGVPLGTAMVFASLAVRHMAEEPERTA